MKRFLLLLLTTVSLVSCQQTNYTSTVTIPSKSPELKVAQTPQTQDNSSVNISGTQTDSTLSSNVNGTVITMDGDNCINSSSDIYETADILTGLIRDTQFRDILQKEYKLSIYTPDYVRTLQKDIQGGINELIIRYMCNIDTNFDIIAGVDYAKEVARYNSLDEKQKSNVGRPGVGRSDILIIRNNSQIIPIDSSVEIYHNSVTGADVSHCKASKKDKTLLWTCLLGFDGPVGDKLEYRQYTIDLNNGKVLSTRTYSENN